MADETPDAPATPAATGLGTLFWEQPALEHGTTQDESSVVIRYAGDYDALKTFSTSFSVGAAHPDDSDYELAEIRLERYEGPSGRLTLTYKDTAPGGGGGGSSGAARQKSVKWGLTSTAQTLSILRYCGPSEGANASRPRIELFMAETDGDLKNVYKYHTGDGAVAELTSQNDKKMADKILAGIESVQRHFPSVRKTTIYTKGSFAPSGDLDVAVTAATLGGYGCPASLHGRAAQWLKSGEDVEIDGDGNQTLVETWIGGARFDPDFYGPIGTRWEPATI